MYIWYLNWKPRRVSLGENYFKQNNDTDQDFHFTSQKKISSSPRATGFSFTSCASFPLVNYRHCPRLCSKDPARFPSDYCHLDHNQYHSKALPHKDWREGMKKAPVLWAFLPNGSFQIAARTEASVLLLPSFCSISLWFGITLVLLVHGLPSTY